MIGLRIRASCNQQLSVVCTVHNHHFRNIADIFLFVVKILGRVPLLQPILYTVPSISPDRNWNLLSMLEFRWQSLITLMIPVRSFLYCWWLFSKIHFNKNVDNLEWNVENLLSRVFTVDKWNDFLTFEDTALLSKTLGNEIQTFKYLNKPE